MKENPLGRLIHSLSRLPGIGEKTATRLAFFLLRSPRNVAEELAKALQDVGQKMRLCSVCCNVTADDPCVFCQDPRREEQTVCVVAYPQDCTAVERSGSYRGRYHVLHGVLSPLDGIGPESLRIQELVHRIEKGGIEEAVLATNANVEGDATALYLARLLRDYPLRITRLGQGMPAGGELEYLDATTLGRAFASRRLLDIA